MKNYNFFTAAALLVLAACQTNAYNSLVWQADGLVTRSDGKQRQLDILGIYDSLSYNGFTYLAGFKIDNEGTNYPKIVRVGNDLSAVNYWAFEKIPNDIFVYREAVHLVSTDGGVFELKNGEWQLTSLTLPPDAQIVYSDNNSNLVVCYPAALAKTVMQQSGCKSLKDAWQVDFVWQVQVPKMCGSELYAVAQENYMILFKKIDITTGKVISSRELKKVPEDICTL